VLLTIIERDSDAVTQALTGAASQGTMPARVLAAELADPARGGSQTPAGTGKARVAYGSVCSGIDGGNAGLLSMRAVNGGLSERLKDTSAKRPPLPQRYSRLSPQIHRGSHLP
jgi:hypothetical protein